MFLHVLSVLAGLVLCIPLFYAAVICIVCIVWKVLSGDMPDWLLWVLYAFVGATASFGGLALIGWGFGLWT